MASEFEIALRSGFLLVALRLPRDLIKRKTIHENVPHLLPSSLFPENFFAYAPDVQGKLLALNPDDALANLLAKEYKESWLAGLLSSETLVGLNAGDSGESTPEFVNLEGFLSLSDKLRESGNSEILEELRELGGGTLSDELLLEGEIFLIEVVHAVTH